MARVYKAICLSFYLTLTLPALSADNGFDNYRVVEKDHKKGVIDENGNIIIPIQYDDLGWSNGSIEILNEVIGFKSNGGWGLINLDNEKLTQPVYHSLLPVNNFIIASRKGKFSQNNFFGLMDFKGQNLVPYQYSQLKFEGKHLVAVYRKQTAFLKGLITTENSILLPFEYQEITSLGGNYYAVKNTDDLYAIFDQFGIRLTIFEYDSLAVFSSDKFITYKDGKSGLINSSGNVLVKNTFRTIKYHEGRIQGLPFNTWVILSPDNIEGQVYYFDQLEPASKYTYKAGIAGFEWIVDLTGKRLSPVVDKIGAFKDGFAIFKKTGKFGLMNVNGKVVYPANTDSIHYEEGFIYVMKYKNGLPAWNLFDTLGIKKSRYDYQALLPKSYRLFPVKRRNKWGFMDRTGAENIHCVYNQVGSWVHSLSVVSFHGETGIINPSGEWVVLPSKSRLRILNDSVYLEMTPYLTSLKNLAGEVIYFTENRLIPDGHYLSEFKNDSLLWHIDYGGRIKESLITKGSNASELIEIQVINNKGRLGAFDQFGNTAIPFNNSYDEVTMPGEGFIGIKSQGLYGFVDLQNKLRIANRYEQIRAFREGLAAVMIRGKWGFINQYDQIVIQPNYEQTTDFSGGVAIVTKEGKYGMIHSDGNVVIPFEYDRLNFRNHLVETVKGGQIGIMDRAGRQILHPKYDEIVITETGYFIVKRNNRYGVIKNNGVSVIPSLYQKILYLPEQNLFLAQKPAEWITIELE